MTRIIRMKSPRSSPSKRFALLTFSAVVLLGTAVSAHADEHRGGDRHEDYRRGGGRRDYRGPAGYYAPPPVVYGGGPYYPPPPVVYAPGIGINLPGVSINVR